MLPKHTLLFTLLSFAVTTAAAPSGGKQDVIVVPDQAAVLHEKREIEEDGPLPVLADDSVHWTVSTTNKRSRGRRRQLPRSQVLALKLSTEPVPTFSTTCYPPLKYPNYATSSVILDCFATQYGNDMTFAAPKTACQDTVCLTVYLPDPPPPDVSSPQNPTSLPFSDFTTELSAADTRLRGQCGDNSINSDDSTNIALGVTTLKDGADIYAIRVDLWDATGDDHSKGGELEWCHNLILGAVDPPHVHTEG